MLLHSGGQELKFTESLERVLTLLLSPRDRGFSCLRQITSTSTFYGGSRLGDGQLLYFARDTAIFQFSFRAASIGARTGASGTGRRRAG